MISEENSKFRLIFSNLDQFYKECDTVEDTGDKRFWEQENLNDSPSWIGLSREKILKSKYMYKEGLDQLKSLEVDLNLGSKRRSYKYDEIDGDDMNYDRFLDDLPSLRKRIVKRGNNIGKIITLHVNVGENCGVTSDAMLIKAYTVMRIVDYLENLGYRTGITVFTDTRDLGTYKGIYVDSLHTEVEIKKPEQPLIKGLILACISPWFLRYHLFKLWTAKIKCNDHLGSSYRAMYEDTLSDIYINTGDCLNEESAKNRINELAKLFKFDE